MSNMSAMGGMAGPSGMSPPPDAAALHLLQQRGRAPAGSERNRTTSDTRDGARPAGERLLAQRV
jgi:hypothetical protein